MAAGEPYPFDMGGGFVPWRRDVHWHACAFAPASIRPLLDSLSFTAGKTAWGAALRFGLVRASGGDMDRIAAALGVHGARVVRDQAALF